MPWETANTVATGTALLALGVSAGSFAYTNYISKKTKRYQYKLDQWHYLRDDIKDQIDKIIESTSGLCRQLADNEDLGKSKEHVRLCHRKSVSEHVMLGYALTRASRSSYASDEEDWSDLHLRPRFGDDTSIDKIGDIMNEIGQVENLLQLAQLAQSALAIWIQMADLIESALRSETYRLDPNFHPHV